MNYHIIAMFAAYGFVVRIGLKLNGILFERPTG